jgi:uncharacterized protein YfkK (UPF0435 family)
LLLRVGENQPGIKEKSVNVFLHLPLSRNELFRLMSPKGRNRSTLQHKGTKMINNIETALNIMGVNIITPEEISKEMGLRLTEHRKHVLSKIPFSEETLQEHRNTHVLVPLFSTTASELEDLFYHMFGDYNQVCLDEGDISKKESTGWHLVRLSIVPDSVSKSYSEQVSLLNKKERVPTACILIYTIIAYSLCRKQKLFTGYKVRVKSKDEDGDYVIINTYYEDEGFEVEMGYNWGGGTVRGLASEITQEL